MVFPAGVITVGLTFGPYIDDVGEIRSGQVSIISAQPRIWTATGVSVVPTSIKRALDGNGNATVFLAATDQAGWTNVSGVALINWTYNVKLELGDSEPIIKEIQLPAEGETGVIVDFDTA